MLNIIPDGDGQEGIGTQLRSYWNDCLKEEKDGPGLDTNAGALRQREQISADVSILVAEDCGRLHDGVEIT